MGRPGIARTAQNHEITETISARLAALTPEKRVLAEQLLARRADRTAGPPRIQPRPGCGPYPLSYAQELLWLVHELSPGTNVYNVSGARRLRGRLDVDALEHALDATVARHDSLRTNFREVAGVTAQVVNLNAKVPLRRVDLRGASPDERECELEHIIENEVRHRFDLREEILLRVTLVQCADDEYVLITAANHIIWDGWSKGVLFRELAALYEAFLDGRPSPLPEPTLQYGDYAAWQREWLRGDVLGDLVGYWRQRLAGAPTLLELPTDHPRPPVQSFRGSRQSLYLPGTLLQELGELARDESCTLFMVLLAAVKVLLHRYCGQDDIVVGTPVASRTRPELENLIGYFTNTVVLRTDLGGNPTFRELMGRVRETALEALAHQDAPFGRVVQALQPDRDLSHSPIFQVLFTLQNAAPETLQLPGMSMELMRTDPGTAKFDLSFGMGERWGQLHTSVEYSTDLFDGDTVVRLRGHLATVMRAIGCDPDRRIAQLPLLTEKERTQLLVRWQEPCAAIEPTPEAPSEPTTLHALFEAQARRTPSAAAVLDRARPASYAQLDRSATQLALHLRELGAAPGGRVGLFIERSLESAIGTLGILKSGAACVPLDPGYPPERLGVMVRDAELRIVVTQERLVQALPANVSEIVRLDTERAMLESYADVWSGQDDVGPTDVAYVIYTSGSTDGPRGVLVTHGGLANHALASIPLYELGPQDRMLQFSSISFDISIEELFATWATGGTVVMRPSDLQIAGRAFLDFLSASGITVLDLPTAFWHEWVRDLRTLGAQPPDSLRLVIVGGERADRTALSQWRGIVGGRVRWINTYGPTEASVIATAWEAPPGELPPGELPIGRVISGVRAYVLDEQMQLVPVGVCGELHIGGAGVARGYLGRSALTAERFVPDPFSADPDARLYRTGDVVRHRPDGNLEFISRRDDQLKIRGFRVELGEIEAALAQHPELRAVAVAAPEFPSGDRRLVGYVVPAALPGPVPGQLRDFLRRTLPEYMVPGVYVTLASLPLNPSGKLDRHQLPPPDDIQLEGRAYVKPSDEVELAVAEIWREILGLTEPVGLSDGFFDLGGHSLLAVRLFAEIERRVGVRLPLAELFRDSTLGHIAGMVRGELASGGERIWSSVVELRRGEADRLPLFLFPGVHGELLIYRDLVSRIDPRQPIYGLQARGIDGRSAPDRTIEEMAAHHAEAIRSVQPHGPYLFCGYCFAGTVAFQAAKNLEEDGERIELVVLIHSMPFGHAPQSGRVQKEHAYLRHFLQRRGTGKFDLLRARMANLRHNIPRDLWLLALDAWLITGRPPPRFLQDITRVNGRACKRFVTPDASCRVVLIRACSGEDPTSYWTQLARGGVENVVIDLPGIDHGNMVFEPFVSTLASELNARLAAA